jgi:hypothetical protein
MIALCIARKLLQSKELMVANHLCIYSHQAARLGVEKWNSAGQYAPPVCGQRENGYFCEKLCNVQLYWLQLKTR